MGLIALYSVIWVLCWCIFPSSFRWYFFLYVILQSCNSCMSGKNPVFGASLFRSCFLFNRDWHAIACPTKSNVFLLDYKKLPSSVIAILHYFTSTKLPGLKRKTTPGANGADHGNAKGLADDCQGPLGCFSWKFRRFAACGGFSAQKSHHAKVFTWNMCPNPGFFLLTGYLSHWQDLYWISNSLRKWTLLNCLFFMGGVPKHHLNPWRPSNNQPGARGASCSGKDAEILLNIYGGAIKKGLPKPVLGAPPELNKTPLFCSHWKGFFYFQLVWADHSVFASDVFQIFCCIPM